MRLIVAKISLDFIKIVAVIKDYVKARAIIGQRGTLPVRPLGYLNFKKVIFRTMRTMRKQFPVSHMTSGEVVHFRETRFHPKKMAAKVEQRDLVKLSCFS